MYNLLSLTIHNSLDDALDIMKEKKFASEFDELLFNTFTKHKTL